MDVSDLTLAFYDTIIQVRSDDPEILRRVANDFSHFVSEEPVREDGDRILIKAWRKAPDYEGLPPLKASVYTPRNICFSDGDTTYIDYFGRALSVYDRKSGSLEIFCEELILLHEIIYLSTLSRVSERLEHRRIHRVHALAVEADGEAALFMMPSGCGKTTLALHILQQQTPYRLISEDSPLVDSSGRVLPFPLRFGVLRNPPEWIGKEHVTYLERMEFEPKYLISLKAFGDAIAQHATLPRFIFIGDRMLGNECRIRKVGYRAGLQGLMRHMIVGVGLYQGVEFLLRSSVFDLYKMSGTFLSRLRRAHSLLRQSRVFSLQLGRDPAQNTTEILRFLESQGFGAPAASIRSEPLALASDA